MEIADLAALDRVMLALRLFFDDLEAWLKRIAGNEDSWLNRLADWFGDGSGLNSTLSLFDFLFVAIPLAIAALALCAAAIFLWRRRARAPLPSLDLADINENADNAIGSLITELPAREQPAALFQRACAQLEAAGALRLERDLTNSTIARSARLSGEPQRLLVNLARAADRAIFGAWQPSAVELQHLHGDCASLIDHNAPP